MLYISKASYLYKGFFIKVTPHLAYYMRRDFCSSRSLTLFVSVFVLILIGHGLSP